MRLLPVIVLLFVSVNCFSQASLKKASNYSETITAEKLKEKLTVLAGPGMEGRETGTQGQVKASRFIEQHMKDAGLLPAVNGSFQMPFPIYRDSVVKASLTINEKPLNWKTDFAAPASNFASNLSFSEFIYVNTDDSAWKQNKIDVSGKLVLLYGKKPKEKGGHSPIPFLVGAVMKKGAAAALVVDSLLHQEITGDFEYNKLPTRQTINYFTITPALAASLLEKKMDSSKLPTMVYKSDITLQYAEKRNSLKSTNVVGYIPGKAKKDEYLVISAHHDHIGMKDSLIWYGADDDGSGTVSLLQIAYAFAKAKKEGYEPERSIVFLSVSGEEKGLWGSRYYTEHPIFPLAHTTADLNIDMVGRVDSPHIVSDTPNYVYVIGDDRISSELVTMTEAANSFTKLQLDRKFNDPKDPNKFYSRSDHYNFAEKGVPVIFYFNGTHPDYHRVTDTVDKINFDVMAKRAQLVFLTAWQMANSPSLLVRDKPLKKNSGGTN